MKRLTDERIKEIKDRVNAHGTATFCEADCIVAALTELQERRAADSEKPNLGWNRDIEALKKHMVGADKVAVVITEFHDVYKITSPCFIPSSYDEDVFKVDDRGRVQYLSPACIVAWLPWEG